MRLNYICQEKISENPQGKITVRATFQILRDDGHRIPPEEQFTQKVEKGSRLTNTTDDNGYFSAEIEFLQGETMKGIVVALHRPLLNDPSITSVSVPLETEK
jgi:hypothetical protein